MDDILITRKRLSDFIDGRTLHEMLAIVEADMEHYDPDGEGNRYYKLTADGQIEIFACRSENTK